MREIMLLLLRRIFRDRHRRDRTAIVRPQEHAFSQRPGVDVGPILLVRRGRHRERGSVDDVAHRHITARGADYGVRIRHRDPAYVILPEIVSHSRRRRPFVPPFPRLLLRSLLARAHERDELVVVTGTNFTFTFPSLSRRRGHLRAFFRARRRAVLAVPFAPFRGVAAQVPLVPTRIVRELCSIANDGFSPRRPRAPRRSVDPRRRSRRRRRARTSRRLPAARRRR